MPLLVAGHEHQMLPPQTGQVTQPTAILSSLTDRGVSNESEMITSISGPVSKSLEHLPSLPLSSFDMDLSLHPSLLLDLQSALVRMESEMSDIKESLDTSINSQAFGRAVKYTTVPTSDEQAHCEFFIKQLVDQAKLCHLSDEECKLLLGLKLTSDK
ncbi:hypothetical protein AeRB84_006697, partial [Aphanomyces euteiches]